LFLNDKRYTEDIYAVASGTLEWDRLKNKSILITGAAGLIGTFLVDLLMYRNNKYNDGITIYAVGRNKEKALSRFKEYFDSRFFVYIQQDIQNPIEINVSVDYIIHGASNTHPIAFSTEPINTLLTCVLGTKFILDFSSIHHVRRTLFISTGEVYGVNRGDVDSFSEDYCGYIDCNIARSCYPEGKRAAESLCQAYIKEKNIDIVIARCCHFYGPTMTDEDSRVIAQFIRNAVNKENIVLKSKGDQLFSYCYVADICTALLVLLLNGKNGEAYNISDNNCNLSLLEIANILSDYTNRKIIFDTPSMAESTGYSKATKRLLDSSKLQKLEWSPMYPIKEGIVRTVEILRNNK